MLWHKSWLETRSRFLIGLALVAASALGTVYAYPQVQLLMPLVPTVDPTTELGRRVQEAAALAAEFRGYIWSQWHRQNLPQIWTIFAVVLAAGGPFAHGAKGALFTLSLPVSRSGVLGVRAATGLVELMAITLVPTLLIPLAAPSIGESYGLTDVLVHSLCLFVGGATFYSLTFLLSMVFDDIWRPLLLALAVAAVLAVCEQVLRGLATYGIFRVMSGETYFRTGSLPWIGLLVTAAVSAVMLYGATRVAAGRDY